MIPEFKVISAGKTLKTVKSLSRTSRNKTLIFLQNSKMHDDSNSFASINVGSGQVFVSSGLKQYFEIGTCTTLLEEKAVKNHHI